MWRKQSAMVFGLHPKNCSKGNAKQDTWRWEVGSLWDKNRLGLLIFNDMNGCCHPFLSGAFRSWGKHHRLAPTSLGAFLSNSQVMHQNFGRAFIIIPASRRASHASVNSSLSVICELLVCEIEMMGCLCPVNHSEAVRLCSLLSGVWSRRSFAVITQRGRVFSSSVRLHHLAKRPELQKNQSA